MKAPVFLITIAVIQFSYGQYPPLVPRVNSSLVKLEEPRVPKCSANTVSLKLEPCYKGEYDGDDKKMNAALDNLILTTPKTVEVVSAFEKVCSFANSTAVCIQSAAEQCNGTSPTTVSETIKTDSCNIYLYSILHQCQDARLPPVLNKIFNYTECTQTPNGKAIIEVTARVSRIVDQLKSQLDRKTLTRLVNNDPIISTAVCRKLRGAINLHRIENERLKSPCNESTALRLIDYNLRELPLCLARTCNFSRLMNRPKVLDPREHSRVTVAFFGFCHALIFDAAQNQYFTCNTSCFDDFSFIYHWQVVASATVDRQAARGVLFPRLKSLHFRFFDLIGNELDQLNLLREETLPRRFHKRAMGEEAAYSIKENSADNVVYTIKPLGIYISARKFNNKLLNIVVRGPKSLWVEASGLAVESCIPLNATSVVNYLLDKRQVSEINCSSSRAEHQMDALILGEAGTCNGYAANLVADLAAAEKADDYFNDASGVVRLCVPLLWICVALMLCKCY